ncbi:hypothetical protein EV192_102687 [Actinocrispum wychmicini]|uniref:ATP-dependent Clp protease adaptor protein ClpS n=1 Tax=Actinocrispum wychmicini TaxID=1213861 RepID=A0A4R2JYM3_9PSEU|nr:hypothetical protein EV192_102687 [Actinocrispum wychmicini]
MVLRDDDINTGATVAFVLHRVVGLPLDQAMDIPARLEGGQMASVAYLSDQHDAEVLAARMQVFGLHSEVFAT